MAVLAITVSGPFAYVEDYPAGYITLMAPMCSQHKGGISNIDLGNEFLLQGNDCNQGRGASSRTRYEYELELNCGNVVGIDWKGAGSVFEPQLNRTTWNSLDWRFWIKLPKPDVAVMINPIPARIYGQIPEPRSPFAVGLRFLYRQWDGADIPISRNAEAARNTDGGPEIVFKVRDLGESGRWDLEIQYTGPVRDDPDHEDAVTCFAALMAGLGSKCSIAFPSQNTFVTHGNDCHAAVAWIGSQAARGRGRAKGVAREDAKSGGKSPALRRG